MHRPTILVLLGCFSRGVEATGPNQSLLGMVERLVNRFRFRVIGEAVAGDVPGAWTEVKGVEQLPLTPGRVRVRGLRRAIAATHHDLLITNSVMDPLFTGGMLLLRKLRLIPRRPVLLAPRGELATGSLGIGARKKAAYLAFLKSAGLLDGVAFQATSALEADEIRAAIGSDTRVFVTPNIRAVPPLPSHRPRADAEPVRLAYLSRIDRKKNLDFALRVLKDAGVPVQFDIYGPVSDAVYWAECERLIAQLPAAVAATYRGTVPQAQVAETMAGYDALFLPTRNENFGHAIADALLAGTPALLSDQTPWRGMAAVGAGWDLPLADPAAFAAAIRELAGLSAEQAARLRSAARRFAEDALDPAQAAAMLEACLDALLGEPVAA